MLQNLLAAVMTVSLLGLAAPAAAQTGEPYRIRPGDRLDISVLEDPGLNRQVLVRPDGRFSVPLAGLIDAADRTPEEVEATIRSRLARDFVAPPSVTVSLVGLADEEAPNSVRFYMIGQVSNPGVYEVEAPIDILQALAVSGGLGAFAAVERIQVRRTVDGSDMVMVFNYRHIERGVVPAQPIMLRDGDVIVVPQRGLFE